MKYLGEWARRAKIYIEGLDYSSGAMRYILLYALLLMFSCLLYIAAWSFRWWLERTPDLKELLSFLHEIASASWVAVIAFIAKSFVDKNKNGVPDQFEPDEFEEKKEE